MRIPPSYKAFGFGVTLSAAIMADGVAQTAVTEPVGFTRVQTLGSSDTLVSTPLTRPAEYVGSIASVSGNVITLSGSPALTTNQFVYAAGTQPKRYYVITSATDTANAKEGRQFLITANTANTLTLNLNGDSLAGIPANAQARIIPYWTLGTVFPAGDAGVSFTPTTTTRTLKTQVLIPDYSNVGTNLSYPQTYYYINASSNVGWRLFGDATTNDHSDDILIPDGYFVVRHDNGAPNLALTNVGSVLTKKFTVPLTTTTTQYQDNAVSIPRPVDVALDSSGLGPVDGSFVATTSTRTILDQLFLFDNSQVTTNKSPVKTYYYFNSGWRLFGDATTVNHGADVIPAGAAIIIRKAPTTVAQTAFWVNSPTY